MSLRVYIADLPLVRPLNLAQGGTHSVREILLLKKDDAWAEASPLPGFSTESREDVLAELRGEREAGTSPSLRFANDALSKVPDLGVDCLISGLLMGEGDALLDSAHHLRATGCPAAKLKVGGRPMEDDLSRVRQVAQLLDGHVALRLDANRQWSLEEAMAFETATRDLTFDYVEEPVEPDSWEAFRATCSWRLAQDESVYLLDNSHPAELQINKPSLTGNTSGDIQSAAFESGVGLYRIAQLASRQPAIPAGLDTARWLAKDVFTSPLLSDGWQLRLPKMPEVNRRLLTEVAI